MTDVERDASFYLKINDERETAPNDVRITLSSFGTLARFDHCDDGQVCARLPPLSLFLHTTSHHHHHLSVHPTPIPVFVLCFDDV